MKIENVPGTNNKHKVFLYALSTCAWCKKTKKFLKDKGVEYQYVDVDLCTQEDMNKIQDDLRKRGLSMAFPLTIIDDTNSVVGYKEDKLNEALK